MCRLSHVAAFCQKTDRLSGAQWDLRGEGVVIKFVIAT